MHSNKDQYSDWSNLAKVVYRRTYSRVLPNSTSKENWLDTVKRVVAGNTTQIKVEESEKDLLHKFIFDRKILPGGRGLWMSGVESPLGGQGKVNCWFWTSDKFENFCHAMDNLMTGGGVGMSVEKQYIDRLPTLRKSPTITHTTGYDADFITPDNREGWCELVYRLLKAHFITGKDFSYSTSGIRPYGEPIKGFGGTASGPKPLIECVDKIHKILQKAGGRKLKPVEAGDIICAIGEMVVAGNVRRSAIILIGDANDVEYLQAKNWSLGNIPNQRAFANYSVIADKFEEIHPEFWQTFMNGEPYGLINRSTMQNFGRIGEYQKDNAQGVNPCVTGDTEILTDSGYEAIETLVGKRVKIWNGQEFSEVTPAITGTNVPVYRVEFSSGESLVCTSNHKFHIITKFGTASTEKQQKQLEIGDKLEKCSYPVIEEGEIVSDSRAYGQGFYSADGTAGYNSAHIYAPKLPVVSRMSGRLGNWSESLKRAVFTFDHPLYEKTFIPFNWHLKSRLAWLAGIFDGDATITKDGNIQLGSIDKKFLLNILKMLNITGITGKVKLSTEAGFKNMPDSNRDSKSYYCQKFYRLLLSAADLKKLINLGLSCNRLDLTKCSPNRDASQFKTVKAIDYVGIAPVVYCFTEPLKHRGIFNGLITGQCGEIPLHNGEPCNIGDVQLHNISDIGEFCLASHLMFRYMKRVTLEEYPNKISQSIISQNGRVGLGLTGCLANPELFHPNVLDEVYKNVYLQNLRYSKQLNVAPSIRTTTIKPAGTGSKVADAMGYEGIHPAYSEYFIQRIRIAANDPLIPLLRAAGHHIEPVERFDGTLDHNTLVVDFYQKAPEGCPVADKDWDTWKQLEVVKKVQRYWADNSVSVTVYYRKEEVEKIKNWLETNFNEIKTISFLCHSDHGFVQAPKEAIDAETYDRLTKSIRPLDTDQLMGDDLLDGSECANGVCPVR